MGFVVTEVSPDRSPAAAAGDAVRSATPLLEPRTKREVSLCVSEGRSRVGRSLRRLGFCAPDVDLALPVSEPEDVGGVGVSPR